MPIMCDNSNAISISKNPVQHFRTNHIDIHYCFLRDHVEEGNIAFPFVPIDAQLDDFFSKLIGNERFIKLRQQLGIGLRPDH